MEDFGYSKQKEENYTSSLIRRAFLIGATLFSIACFIYITISAYYFFSQDANNIETIHAQSTPIKIVENSEITPSDEAIQIDNSIYEDIFGTRKQSTPIIIKAVQPAIAPKEEIEKFVEKDLKKTTEPQKIIVYTDTKPQAEQVSLNEKPQKPTRKSQRTVKVQIAALTSKKSANEYFKTLQNQYPSLFDELESFVQEVDLGKRGIFYRVQIGNFFDQLKAEKFCKAYITKTHKSKADCIVVE